MALQIFGTIFFLLNINYSFEHNFNNLINKDDTIGCHDLQSFETELVEATKMTDTGTEKLGWGVLLCTLKDMHQELEIQHLYYIKRNEEGVSSPLKVEVFVGEQF